METNLVVLHGIADILDYSTKLIRILYAVQELRNFASLCEGGKVPENIIQFPSNLRVSEWLLTHIWRATV